MISIGFSMVQIHVSDHSQLCSSNINLSCNQTNDFKLQVQEILKSNSMGVSTWPNSLTHSIKWSCLGNRKQDLISRLGPKLTQSWLEIMSSKRFIFVFKRETLIKDKENNVWRDFLKVFWLIWKGQKYFKDSLNM